MATPFSYRSARFASAGVLRQCFSGVERDEASDEFSGDAEAARHGGTIRVKVEANVHFTSVDDGAPAAAGEGGVALPVPNDVDDGDARPAMDDSRPLGKARRPTMGSRPSLRTSRRLRVPSGLTASRTRGGQLPPRLAAKRLRSSAGCLSSPSPAERGGSTAGKRVPTPPTPATGALRRTRWQLGPARRPPESSPSPRSRSSAADSGLQSRLAAAALPTSPTRWRFRSRRAILSRPPRRSLLRRTRRLHRRPPRATASSRATGTHSSDRQLPCFGTRLPGLRLGVRAPRTPGFRAGGAGGLF